MKLGINCNLSCIISTCLHFRSRVRDRCAQTSTQPSPCFIRKSLLDTLKFVYCIPTVWHHSNQGTLTQSETKFKFIWITWIKVKVKLNSNSLVSIIPTTEINLQTSIFSFFLHLVDIDWMTYTPLIFLNKNEYYC